MGTFTLQVGSRISGLVFLCDSKRRGGEAIKTSETVVIYCFIIWICLGGIFTYQIDSKFGWHTYVTFNFFGNISTYIWRVKIHNTF